MDYDCTALVTLLSLLLYWVLTINVGRARGKYGVKAPAISGDPAFDRVFRVHQNTMEALVLYLPALWLFAIYVSDAWAAGVGAVWIVGRIIYARAYYADASKRGAGMLIATLATVVLFLGALIALGTSFYRS
ncbi:MAG: MAPEG family protein [Stenotrophobium sp.]